MRNGDGGRGFGESLLLRVLCDRLAARATRASFFSAEAGFIRMVGARGFRLFHSLFDDAVIAMRQDVAAVVAVERGREASDVDALSYAPPMPIGFARENLNVLCTEMVVGVSSMLHDGRFVGPRR